ncbi:MAG: SDR family NAD(P)-dependent oxidoreductase [Pseudomonadales bacterium]
MSETPALCGKHVFITGGSGGIGSACAAAFLRDGAAITLMARRQDALEKTKAELLSNVPGCAEINLFAGDALNTDDVIAAVAFAVERSGPLNICVPTVGGGAIRPLLTHSAETFMQDIELNVLSCFLAVRYCVPEMVKSGGGSIVIISSDAAKLAFPWLPAYCTAKAALEGMTRQLAEELSRYKIRVNAVRPGLTRTECTKAIFADESVVEKFAAEKPLGRLGEPEDIAAGVRYLAGPESSWITGQSLAIEGGNELRSAADQGALVQRIFGEEVWQKVLAGEDPGPC